MGDERFVGVRDSGSMASARAALEALFAPKSPAPPPVVSKRDSAKMVTARAAVTRAPEEARLVAKLLAAQGRAEVSRVADEIARAGVALPDDQEVHLQLLEHTDEARVRDALGAILRLLDAEPPKRRTVLDARLRRIEDAADEAATRALGSEVRRKLARAARPL